MEVLSPSHPALKTEALFSGFMTPSTFRNGFGRNSRKTTCCQPLEIVEEDGQKVYVAVGKSVDKAVSLLQWTIRTFVNSEICILHVHQPSPLIPTLCELISLLLYQVFCCDRNFNVLLQDSERVPTRIILFQ